jgi:hypothetical protein
MAGYRIPIVMFIALIAVSSADAQNVLMRRTNTAGNWRLYVNNNGVLFNQSDRDHLLHDGVGGFWFEPSGTMDSMIFGAGIWLGGLRHRGEALHPHVEYSYEPNHGVGGFVPGSVVYDGDKVDTSQAGRDNYHVYRSSDIAGPAWPIRSVNGLAHYIHEPLSRTSAGPPATIGDEDVFAVYKDTDPTWASDSIGDPFRLEVRTQVATWRTGLLKDVALVHSEIIYSGQDTVFEPVVATVIDADILNENDDQLKRVQQNEGALAAVFYTANSTTEPMLGVTMFGQQGPHRTTTGITVMRYWDIFSDPTTDSERYDFLTDQRHDLVLSREGDARLLLSSKSTEPWLPGDTIDFDFVLFAKPASGSKELSALDSAAMLGIAEKLTSHYFSNTLGDLYVNPATGPAGNSLKFERFGDRLVAHDARAQLFDILGRNVLNPAILGDSADFDLNGLPRGCYYLVAGGKSVKVIR